MDATVVRQTISGKRRAAEGVVGATAANNRASGSATSGEDRTITAVGTSSGEKVFTRTRADAVTPNNHSLDHLIPSKLDGAMVLSAPYAPKA